MAQPKTKKPSGVTITRDGAGFITKWKIADEDYGDGQIFQYYNTLTKKWVSTDMWSRSVSKKITIDTTKFYPNTAKKLTSFRSRIRGNRSPYSVQNGNKTTRYDPTVSDWTDKTYEILIPDKPALEATLSPTYSNITTFTWNLATSRESRKWCSDLQYQTILVQESDGDGPSQNWKASQLEWETGIVGSSSSKSITEDSALLADASYTRWFRIRARGPAGNSDWRYAKHVYAKPYQAKIKSATLTNTNTGGYMCRVEWEAQKNAAHPIDKVIVQYAFAIPVTGMRCPDQAGWQNADVVADTSGNDAVSFSIGAVVEEDQCLFVRVNTMHDRDNNTTEGIAQMVTAGYLADPENLEVEMNQSTRLALISADNTSQNPDSFLAVVFKTSDDPDGYISGIIPHGRTETTVKVPDAVTGQEIVFGVYAVVGDYEEISRADEVTRFAVNEIIRSANTVVHGGDIPLAPANVALSMTDIVGAIRVTWDWSWRAATAAELSWADHADAWESTSGPTTYTINNTHAAAWNISGLAIGKRWYVRVRLTSGSGDGKTYGAYSSMASIDLSNAPSIPVLTLSEGVITEEGSITASWNFASGDGSQQAYAEIADVTEVSGTLVYTPIASTQSATHVTINAREIGWQSGESHALAVRVVSASGRQSDGWSDLAYVSIADPITAEITQTSLEEITVTEDESERTVMSLTEMPLTVTVTGAGAGGVTSIVIERADAYQVDRPDESQFYGYEGETIAYLSYNGEGQATIDEDILVGSLDDEAKYRIIATVQDGLGQSSEVTQEFEVHWSHQADMPTATVVIDRENLIAIILPDAEDPAEGDTCDIYRLSVDKPELIYPNAEFGTRYVDPYPAIGEFGGHRIVYKTANGDYITEDNQLAWIDLKEPEGDIIETDFSVIDFGSGRILIDRNLDISNSWSKDFEETQYLGGSVQGDWNPAVSRKTNVATVAVSILDQETIQAMRRLAVHAGICHVRTSDGSSYAANVEVSDSYSHDTRRKVITYNLSINRVDPESYDGMTLADWSATHANGYSSVVGTGVVGNMIVGG